jgi:transcriptional regulator with XRE-family HTH domain
METTTLGETLMLARKRAGLTQTSIAKTLGVSKAFISYVERGEKKFPVERLEMLPEPIRRAVAGSMVEQRQAEIAELERFVAE